MSKTLVNIITEDNPIPAYLFIKEMYEEGDRLMYISAKDTEDVIELSEVKSFKKSDDGKYYYSDPIQSVCF